MKWVTRERPKIDRRACPWPIKRFIDSEAEFLYVSTNALSQAPEAAGLLAIPVGMGCNIEDDQLLLSAASGVYDALYAWCRSGSERHGWQPESMRK